MPSKSGSSPVKLIVYAGILAAAAAAATYFLRARNGQRAPEFATTVVSRGDIVQTVTATGQLDPLLTVDVSSQISGLVKEIFVDFNSRVKGGQRLAEIDPATYQQRLRQAEADLASAEASNKLARLNATRIEELHEKRLVTQQEFDQSMAQLAQSDAQLLTRQAAVENAKVDLGRCTLFSPIDGIVISKQTEVGKTVAASLNAPTLFVIANDLAKMQITAAVAEADIGAVREGQDVTFSVDAFPNRSFAGRVTQVRNAPKNQQNVVTYETIIDVDNRDLQLRPGMTANVSIIVAKRENTLRVGNAVLRVRMPESIEIRQASVPEGTAATGAAREVASAESAPNNSAAGDSAPRERGERGGRGGGGRGGMFGADLTDEQRAKLREIMAEVGFTPGQGPVPPEVREKVRQLAAAAGITLGGGGGGSRGEAAAVVTRTVYRLPGGDKSATPEAVSVRVGITDGFASEILGGIDEGDVLISAVTAGGQVAASGPGQQGQNNPFSGRRRGF